MTPKSARLDRVLVSMGLTDSREQARSLIIEGKVLVNGLPAVKPATQVMPEDRVNLKAPACPYVSRGGLKLEAALKALKILVEGTICLDVGASTGGFSDCLLQFGAQKVYAVDVGYGQLAWKLRNDSRVVVIERTNIRNARPELVPEPVDLITIDVSFISLKIVVPAIMQFMHATTRILALIKPQFELLHRNPEGLETPGTPRPD